MTSGDGVFDRISGLYTVIPLVPFRHTKGVSFDIVPRSMIPEIAGIDRVIHEKGAVSPGAIGDIQRPWYMHPFQEDYLLVLQGRRVTEIYHPDHGKVESFEVCPDKILHAGKLYFDGPAMLVWHCGVFHRIQSDETTGSISLNFAIRHEGFDIKTNFNIYDLNPEKGTWRILREGYLDQVQD